jgi:hypothetical protein
VTLAQSRPEGGDSDGEESSQGREEEGGQEKIASRFADFRGTLRRPPFHL